jgi:pyridoxal phosphate enzyme (YggS family)
MCNPFLTQLSAVQQRIHAACVKFGRPTDSVTLLAVSKTFPAEAVTQMAALGQHAFGENYVKEGVDKIARVYELTQNFTKLFWHFIGPLQSNKTKPVAEHFDWVHSVDRLKIAQRLSEQRSAGLDPLNVCIQVNISNEASKSGIAPDHVLEVAKEIVGLPHLKLRGLMAIPEPTSDEQLARANFKALADLLAMLNNNGFSLDTLSMGMSADLEWAIAEGATIVRVGTALFGTRATVSEAQTTKE